MMQRKIIHIALFFLLSIFFGSISCNKFDELKSPVEGFNLILNYDIFETFISLRFIDAPTGELIGSIDDEKVKIRITGAGAGGVVDQLGNHDTIFKSVFGIINLALNPNQPWMPGPQNIVNINIETENERYTNSAVSIAVDTVGNYRFDVFLEPNNVNTIGKKEYTRYLSYNESNGLVTEFPFSSSGGEMQFLIPKGTRFLNAVNEAVSAEEIKVHIVYFLDNSKAPLPKGLINNIKNKEGQVTENAVDFYQFAELSFFDEKGEKITPIETDINILVRFKPGYYNPLEKRKIQENDEITTLKYKEENNIWEENGITTILNDSLGFYAKLSYPKTSYFALANFVQTCTLNAKFLFDFINVFDELPVAVRVNNYRKYDNRHIGTKVINVENENEFYAADFVSIENEEIKFIIQNHSSYNPFKTDISTFYSKQSCGNLETPFSIAITSQRTQVDAELLITTNSKIPDEGIELYADIVRSSDNNRLFRKKIMLYSPNERFTFSTGILADVDAYITLTTVSSRFSLEKTPLKIPFNTSTGPFNWSFAVNFEDVSREFVFDFDIDESFGNRQLFVRVDFENLSSNRVEQSLVFPISRENAKISKKLVLDENKNYRINLKRIAGKELFMAYPYQLTIGSGKETTTFFSEITPVQKREVNATIKVQCGSSIVFPTLNGLFRAVWDDHWKEIEIQDGIFTQIFKIGGTYEIGTIFEGELVSTKYVFDETEIDITLEMKGGFCDSMGW